MFFPPNITTDCSISTVSRSVYRWTLSKVNTFNLLAVNLAVKFEMGRSRERRRRSPSRSRERPYRHPKGHHVGYYESRVKEREDRRYSIWDSIRSPSPEPLERYKSSFKRHAPSSSIEERKDRKKKHRKKKNKAKKKKEKKRKRTPSPSSNSSSSSSSDEEPPQDLQMEEDEDIIGPRPLQTTEDKQLHYGKALLPGEGAAIAQYVQKNMRIPRRGEVGWDGKEIDNLEGLGYVMSGSRHTAMNAVRIRKENQVYSAEEKRALAVISLEEKKQRENTVMSEFRSLLTDRLTKKHGSAAVEAAEEKKDPQ